MSEISGNLMDFKIILKSMINSKESFATKMGNFSAEIILSEKQKFFFTNSQRDFRIFHAVKALKKDLQPHLDFFSTKKYGLSYFFLKSGFQKKVGKFYNIDIKKAYPQTLYNTFLLKKETEQKIEALKKPDKLAVVGMLAYEPELFYFEKGKVIGHERIKSIYSPCFFYCVEKIQNLMLQIINELDGDYFFTWVDGIFFEENLAKKNKIVDIIRANGYECSFDTCYDLEVDHTNESLFFKYKKGDEEKSLIFPDHNQEKRKKYEEFVKIVNDSNDESQRFFLENYFVLDKFGKIKF